MLRQGVECSHSTGPTPSTPTALWSNYWRWDPVQNTRRALQGWDEISRLEHIIIMPIPRPSRAAPWS